MDEETTFAPIVQEELQVVTQVLDGKLNAASSASNTTPTVFKEALRSSAFQPMIPLTSQVLARKKSLHAMGESSSTYAGGNVFVRLSATPTLSSSVATLGAPKGANNNEDKSCTFRPSVPETSNVLAKKKSSRKLLSSSQNIEQNAPKEDDVFSRLTVTLTACRLANVTVDVTEPVNMNANIGDERCVRTNVT
jgi:hypothetical protein